MTNIKNISSTQQFYFLILCLSTKFCWNQFIGWKVENVRYNPHNSSQHILQYIPLNFHGANIPTSGVYFQVGLYFLLMNRSKWSSPLNKLEEIIKPRKGKSKFQEEAPKVNAKFDASILDVNVSAIIPLTSIFYVNMAPFDGEGTVCMSLTRNSSLYNWYWLWKFRG